MGRGGEISSYRPQLPSHPRVGVDGGTRTCYGADSGEHRPRQFILSVFSDTGYSFLAANWTPAP